MRETSVPVGRLPAWLLPAGAVAGVAAIFVAAKDLASGSRVGLAGAAAIALAPLLLYLSLFRPLVFPFSVYAAMVPWDNLLPVGPIGSVTKLLAILSGAAILFMLLRTRRFASPSAALVGWALFTLWTVMSLFWAIDADVSMERLPTYVQLFLLYAMLALVVPTEFELWTVIGATVLGGLAAAGYGAYLFHNGIDVQFNRLFLSNGEHFIDPNHAAAALLLPIALVMGGLFGAPKAWQKFGLLCALLVLGAGFFAAGSRGSLLAVGVMLAYFVWRSPQARIWAVGVGVVLLGVLVFAPDLLLARFQDAASTGGAGRMSIWMVGLEYFRHHWLFGAGVNNFTVAYDESYLNVYQAYHARWHRVAHNVVVSGAVEFGIIGLSLMLYAWYKQLRSLEHIDRAHRLYFLRLSLEAATIGLFVAGLFLDVIWYKYAWLTFSLGAMVRAATFVPAAKRIPVGEKDARDVPAVPSPAY